MFLKNYGATAINVVAGLQTADPYVTIHSATAPYGSMGTGAVLGNGTAPFSISAASYTPDGHVVDLTIVATFAGGQTVSDARLFVGHRPYLVWDPSPDQSSGPVIHTTLRQLDYAGSLTSDLPLGDLDAYRCLFISVGVYSSNYIIPANSPEAQAIVAFIQQGGCAYLEGGDVWYYDPTVGGHYFGSLFGLFGTADGSGDLYRVQGIAGGWTEGMDFAYTGENSYIDRLMPTGTGYAIFTNNSPYYPCGIANETASYRTVGCSFEFAGLADGSSPSTRLELAQAIMDFFVPPDPQAVPEADRRAGLTWLAPAQPNPCPGHTTLRYGLAQDAPVRIGLYDAAGRCVRILVDRPQAAGPHTLGLDARGLAAGHYFIRSRLGERTLSAKLILTR